MRIALVIGCIALAGCELDVAPAESATLTSARYTAAWAGVDTVIESDLGYSIEIDRGYLVSYRAQLVPCVVAQSDSESADASATTSPRVEQLAPVTDRVLDAVAFAETEYCQLHYILARGSNTTSWLPDDVGMIGRTLYLEGRYRDAVGDEHSFVVDTSLAYAALVELGSLPQTDPESAGASGGVDVVIERRWDTSFDGIDFVSMDDDDIAFRLLANLVDHAEISLSFTSGDVL